MKRIILVSAVCVMLAGMATAVYAATNIFTALQAESGTRTGNATHIADGSAGGGMAVKFGEAAVSSCPISSPVTVINGNKSQYPAYPIGTEVYVPGGPDPWGGCFPNEHNTGIPAGTTLTNYTGPCTITTPNTTIESRTITCNLTITAANVTIRNSKITASNIFVNSGSLLFTDNEVDFGSNINGEGLVGSNFTVLRANMYGGKRQVWCESNCTLQDSYLHDQLSDPTGVTHESAARVQQNTTFRHNTLNCNAPNFPPDAGCSANQTGYPDFTPIHDVTLERNLYMATTGGYCSYGGNSNGKPYSNHALNGVNIRSIENVFQRGAEPNDRTSIPLNDRRRYTCGYYGVTTAYNSSKSGFVFTGNRWDDGLLFANDTTYPYGGFY